MNMAECECLQDCPFLMTVWKTCRVWPSCTRIIFVYKISPTVHDIWFLKLQEAKMSLPIYFLMIMKGRIKY